MVYVRAKGQPRTSASASTSGNNNNNNNVNEDALRCTRAQLCDTTKPDIVCVYEKKISTVPYIKNRAAVTVAMHANALTKVAKDDFKGMGKMVELDLDQNVITRCVAGAHTHTHTYTHT